jgi:hypothetical protein
MTNLRSLLSQLKFVKQSERTIQQMLLKSGVGGAISLIPLGVGATINQMLTQLVARRANERMEQMFDEMAGKIRDLGEEKINRDWFSGEEFQTLLFEALHQLHVTDDKRKIEMLGKALANSGAIEFKNESRKQLFLQLVRTLTPQHIVALRGLLPRTRPKHLTPESCPDSHLWQQRPKVTGSNLLVLQTLAANGLVEESLESAAKRPSVRQYASRGEIDKTVDEVFKSFEKPPIRYFRLSEQGMDFLKFVGAVPEKQTEV